MTEVTRSSSLREAIPCVPNLLIAGGLSGIFIAAVNTDLPAAGVAVGATIVGVASLGTNLARDHGKLIKTNLATIFASLALSVTSVTMSLRGDGEIKQDLRQATHPPVLEIVEPLPAGK